MAHSSSITAKKCRGRAHQKYKSFQKLLHILSQEDYANSQFAEAHGKSLCVREAIGAGVPSAGVGCAISRSALHELAGRNDGDPFDPLSLTEDYELGLAIAEYGGRGIFVRMNGIDGSLICTREYFPETVAAAVRQKSRWMTGIALSGWDRMGWRGGISERWMRLHDRRAILAALVLCAAYLAMLLYGLNLLLGLIVDRPVSDLPPLLRQLLLITASLMIWRMGFRAFFVGRAYGWRQAFWSMPRTLVANIIALMAARRAMGTYLGTLKGAKAIWEKTEHRFPAAEPEANAS